MFLTDTEKKELFSIMGFFVSHKKILLLSLLLGATIGGGASFFIPPKYAAKTLIFAVNYADLEKNQANIPFGLDIHADHLMQMLISTRLKDSVIQHLDLIQYYGIDKNRNDWREQVYQNWENDVQIHKTRFLSIEIEVKTKQAQLSADIANQIVSYADKIYNQMLDENEAPFMQNFSKNYDQRQHELSILSDSLERLRLAKKDTFYINRLKNQINLQAQYANGELKKQYDYAKSRFERKLVVLNVIETALPAGRKSSPSFTLNILIGATIGLFFTIIAKLLPILFKQIRNM